MKSFANQLSARIPKAPLGPGIFFSRTFSAFQVFSFFWSQEIVFQLDTQKFLTFLSWPFFLRFPWMDERRLFPPLPASCPVGPIPPKLEPPVGAGSSPGFSFFARFFGLADLSLISPHFGLLVQVLPVAGFFFPAWPPAFFPPDPEGWTFRMPANFRGTTENFTFSS